MFQRFSISPTEIKADIASVKFLNKMKYVIYS